MLSYDKAIMFLQFLIYNIFDEVNVNKFAA